MRSSVASRSPGSSKPDQAAAAPPGEGDASGTLWLLWAAVLAMTLGRLAAVMANLALGIVGAQGGLGTAGAAGAAVLGVVIVVAMILARVGNLVAGSASSVNMLFMVWPIAAIGLLALVQAQPPQLSLYATGALLVVVANIGLRSRQGRQTQQRACPVTRNLGVR